MQADQTADETELREVKQAAQEAAKIFYPRAEKRKSVYGFMEADHLDSAVLGEPARLFFIDATDIQAYHDGQGLEAILKPSGQWFVPVAIGGTNRAMLGVVDDGKGHWTGSTFGMAPLARVWQSLREDWPATKQFTPKLVICPPVEGYFFTVPQVQPANLTPLANVSGPGTEARSNAKPALAPATETFRDLRKKLAAQSGP